SSSSSLGSYRSGVASAMSSSSTLLSDISLGPPMLRTLLLTPRRCSLLLLLAPCPCRFLPPPSSRFLRPPSLLVSPPSALLVPLLMLCLRCWLVLSSLCASGLWLLCPLRHFLLPLGSLPVLVVP